MPRLALPLFLVPVALLALVSFPAAIAAAVVVVFFFERPSRVPRVLAVALLAAMLVPTLALAQTTTVTSSSPDTTINVGQLVGPWLTAIVGAIVAVLLALFGWLAAVFNKWAGTQNNAAVLAMEAHARELLETALNNAAGSIVMAAGKELDNMKLDVKSPILATGIVQVNTWAQDAVKRFGLSPDDIAKKLIDKIGVITAANPAVTPTAVPTTPSSTTPAG